MSNYFLKAKNKETGEVVEVAALDNHYGNHEYGYNINGSTCNQKVFDLLYEVV